jgi:uncharacterized membrane protein YgcG
MMGPESLASCHYQLHSCYLKKHRPQPSLTFSSASGPGGTRDVGRAFVQPGLCPGLLYLRPTPAAVGLAEAMLQDLETGTNEGLLLSTALLSPPNGAPDRGVSLRLLPRRHFLDSTALFDAPAGRTTHAGAHSGSSNSGGTSPGGSAAAAARRLAWQELAVVHVGGGGSGGGSGAERAARLLALLETGSGSSAALNGRESGRRSLPGLLHW